MLKRRGFTDKLYAYNFIAVQLLMVAVCLITALSGVLGITDLSPLSNAPQWAYTELGLHTGFIIWKAKAENSRKFKFGTNGVSKEVEEFQPESEELYE